MKKNATAGHGCHLQLPHALPRRGRPIGRFTGQGQRFAVVRWLWALVGAFASALFLNSAVHGQTTLSFNLPNVRMVDAAGVNLMSARPYLKQPTVAIGSADRRWLHELTFDGIATRQSWDSDPNVSKVIAGNSRPCPPGQATGECRQWHFKEGSTTEAFAQTPLGFYPLSQSGSTLTQDINGIFTYSKAKEGLL